MRQVFTMPLVLHGALAVALLAAQPRVGVRAFEDTSLSTPVEGLGLALASLFVADLSAIPGLTVDGALTPGKTPPDFYLRGALVSVGGTGQLTFKIVEGGPVDDLAGRDGTWRRVLAAGAVTVTDGEWAVGREAVIKAVCKVASVPLPAKFKPAVVHRETLALWGKALVAQAAGHLDAARTTAEDVASRWPDFLPAQRWLATNRPSAK